MDPANIVLPSGLATPTAVVVEESKEESEKRQMLVEYDKAVESIKGIEKELDDVFEEKSTSLFTWSGTTKGVADKD